MMERLFPKKETTVSTKQKILETAVDLFSRHGYSAVSIRDITKQVGIKESALYNHYKTKDDILATIYSVFCELRGQALPNREQLKRILEEATPEAFLRQGFNSFKQSVNDPLNMKLWRILNIEQFRDDRARDIILGDMYAGTLSFLESAFSMMMDSKQIKPGDPKQLAFEYQYPLFAVMTEYLLLKAGERDTSELEGKVERHIDNFIAKIKA